jgi:hypothetical protein
MSSDELRRDLSDFEGLQAFVEEHFKRASPGARRELTAEAIIYLAGHEHGELGADEERLLAHLTQYYRRESEAAPGGGAGRRSWRERSASEMAEPFDTPLSEDEKLSQRAGNLDAADSAEELRELEALSARYEALKDEWRAKLPLAVFEALERRLRPDAPVRWTEGLDGHGLLILFRRARIRMTWEDEDTHPTS